MKLYCTVGFKTNGRDGVTLDLGEVGSDADFGRRVELHTETLRLYDDPILRGMGYGPTPESSKFAYGEAVGLAEKTGKIVAVQKRS